MKQLSAPHPGFRPVSYPQGSLTQRFGENATLYRECCDLAGHNGIDSVAPWGSPIWAVSKQKVVEVKEDPNGYGKHIRCIDEEFEYTYGHLSEINVEIGQQLVAGQQLGRMGNTGFVVSGATPYWKYNPYAGTHLHLTIRRFKKYAGGATWSVSYPSGDKGDIENLGNGYKGALDPLKCAFITPTHEEVVTGAQLTLIGLLNRLLKMKKNV